MPVRSLGSSVMKWPDGAAVDRAVRCWAADARARHPGLLRLGYFGSYARGDWGVGSDLDVIAVVAADPLPFERRTISWDTRSLPVPTDLLVYTADEWQQLLSRGGKFAGTVRDETVWVFVHE